MCGIVGYIGNKEARPILIDGLSRLEYRGYDSSGIVVINDKKGCFELAKEKGKIKMLVEKLKKNPCDGSIGIGHTRWATHGEPSEVNAHPHLDEEKRFAIVHNGIFENYQEIRTELTKEGYTFVSETDTECAVHLIAKYYNGDLRDALEKAVARLNGSFVVLAMALDDPDTIVAYKRSNPLVIGIGKDANYIASDVSALLAYTKNVVYVEDDHIVVLTKDKVKIFKNKGKSPIKHKVSKIQWSITQAQKGGYPHFMLKEMFEQPAVVETTVKYHVNKKKNAIYFPSFSRLIDQRIKSVNKVFIVSCGTAYHSGLVAKYMIEEYAKIPVEVNVSSEFRYSDPILSKDDLVILITQSGETADTLAAMHEAKAKGAMTLAVCNVVASTIAREADSVVYTHAGPEISVASTKAYLAQLTTLCMLAIYFGRRRGMMTKKSEEKHIWSLEQLSGHIQTILKSEKTFYACAELLYKSKNFIYLGRGFNYATALEGALKLKEISYIHAHGYAAGEMKHGPIALVDNKLPIICIASDSKTYEKMLSNMQEVKARQGIVIAVATEGNTEVKRFADYVFYIPKTYELMSPILAIVPLQCLAYKVAELNGCEIDQPKNLAKSVTVE
jgi:glucosamine--fructose-6-phosphate aminotransferase (isomerizing)